MEYINNNLFKNNKPNKFAQCQKTATMPHCSRFSKIILLIFWLQIPAKVLTAALPVDSLEKDLILNNVVKELWWLHQYGHGGAELSTRRKYKRQHDLPFFQIQHHNITEWMNPCGGIYNPQELTITPEEHSMEINMEFLTKPRLNRHKIKPYLRLLRRSIKDQYNTIQGIHKSIDITDFEQWQKWTHRYEFLPKIERNSTVKLRKWYRHMQTYIGAFAFLGREWYNWDVNNQLRRDATNELHALLISARSILCEIETAINGSNAASGGFFRYKLPVYTKSVMHDMLEFHSKMQLTHELQAIDLIFLKKYYLDYLDTMNFILYKYLRHPTQHHTQIIPQSYETFSDLLDESAADNISQSLSGIMGSKSSSDTA